MKRTELYHYGVKGMRRGVRKSKKYVKPNTTESGTHLSGYSGGSGGEVDTDNEEKEMTVMINGHPVTLTNKVPSSSSHNFPTNTLNAIREDLRRRTNSHGLHSRRRNDSGNTAYAQVRTNSRPHSRKRRPSGNSVSAVKK